MKKIIVTGGLGFIGSNLIELLLKKDFFVINIDKTTYSSNFYNTKEFAKNKNYKLSNDTSIQVDYYLMSILEVKRSFFRKKLIGARVPKEFVDLSAKYFYGCDFTIPIEWKEKKGRRNKKRAYQSHGFWADPSHTGAITGP